VADRLFAAYIGAAALLALAALVAYARHRARARARRYAAGGTQIGGKPR
jgi:hypothetical protein